MEEGQEGNIKDGGEYEFDLCRRGQHGSTPDICKDTVTTKHLINTHTRSKHVKSRCLPFSFRSAWLA